MLVYGRQKSDGNSMRYARHSERWSSLWTALEEHVWNTGCPEVFQEIKADTQFAEMFVEQLGRDNATLVDVPDYSQSLIILVMVENLIKRLRRSLMRS